MTQIEPMDFGKLTEKSEMKIEDVEVSSKPKTGTKKSKENVMRKIQISKITLNIGTGIEEENVKKAILLLSKFSSRKPVQCLARKRIATFKIRPGMPIGAKLTLRGNEAKEVLLKLLQAKDNSLTASCFDENGFSFGIMEYIDIPGFKYDVKIGMLGFDVCVSLSRPGFRIKTRKLNSKISKKHKILKEDSISFAEKELGVKIV